MEAAALGKISSSNLLPSHHPPPRPCTLSQPLRYSPKEKKGALTAADLSSQELVRVSQSSRLPLSHLVRPLLDLEVEAGLYMPSNFLNLPPGCVLSYLSAEVGLEYKTWTDHIKKLDPIFFCECNGFGIALYFYPAHAALYFYPAHALSSTRESSSVITAATSHLSPMALGWLTFLHRVSGRRIFTLAIVIYCCFEGK